jgi:glyoxylase I family protein
VPVEGVIGIDHIFVTVRDLRPSEEFYDRVIAVLGFRKWETLISSDPHVIYYNRYFAYS